MASQNYLIAIALIEQNLVRAMPLGGKEIKDNLEESENFKKLGEEVILNLLMRVFQRSDEGALKRASEEKGLLLVHMHPKRMQKELPFIKSEWIRDGDTQQFLKYLGNLSKEVWTASFIKYKGIACPHFDEEKEREPYVNDVINREIIKSCICIEGNCALHVRNNNDYSSIDFGIGRKCFRVFKEKNNLKKVTI